MKNIKNKILIFTLSSIFLGCSQSATSVFNKDPLYAQNIQYSKVLKSIEKENVNAIFNITYLNSVDSSKWDNDKQNFLIGSYTFDNNQTDFKLSMNNMSIINSKPVKKTDKIYKNIAFKNHWATYSIVTFNNTESKTITLQYTHPNYKNISVSFTKE